MAVDEQLHGTGVILPGQILRGEVPQHRGGDGILPIQVAVEPVGGIQQAELTVHSVEEAAHIVNMLGLSEDGVGEVHQVQPGEPGGGDKALILLEKGAELAGGEGKAGYRPLGDQVHVPALGEVVHDVIVTGDTLGIVGEVSIEEVCQQVSAVIHLAVALEDLVVHPEGGDRRGRAEDLYPGHRAAPVGGVGLQGGVESGGVGITAGVRHQDGGVGDGGEIADDGRLVRGGEGGAIQNGVEVAAAGGGLLPDGVGLLAPASPVQHGGHKAHGIHHTHPVDLPGGADDELAKLGLGEAGGDLNGDGVKPQHIGHSPAETAAAPVDVIGVSRRSRRGTPGGGNKDQVCWIAGPPPVIRSQAAELVFVAEGGEGGGAILGAEPDHDAGFLTGGHRVPEGLGVSLLLIDIVGEAHHTDLLAFGELLILLDDLVEALGVGGLVRFPSGVGVEVDFRLRRGAGVLPRQEGEDRRAVHRAVVSAVVDVVKISTAVLGVTGDGLVHIGDDGALAGETVAVEDVHIEAGVLAPLQQGGGIVARRETLKAGFVGNGQGVSQGGGGREVGGDPRLLAQPVGSVRLHAAHRLDRRRLTGKAQRLDGAGILPLGGLGQPGDDGGCLAAADGLVGGEGAIGVIAHQDACPVEEEDVLAVGGGGVDIRQSVDEVDGRELALRQGGGENVGHLSPGDGLAIAAGELLAGEHPILDGVVQVDLVPRIALDETALPRGVAGVEPGRHGDGLGHGDITVGGEVSVGAPHQSQLIGGGGALGVPGVGGDVLVDPCPVGAATAEVAHPGDGFRRGGGEGQGREGQAQGQSQQQGENSFGFHTLLLGK